jgi:hypothetical protein
VAAVNHRFALSKPALLSAPSKKSFSSVSSPILACRDFTSTGGSAGRLSWPNTSAARLSNCSFHCAIWLAWTSKRLASSASVCSPLIAAKATLDLKAGEWFRRVRRVMICSWGGDIIASVSRKSTYRAVQISGASSLGPIKGEDSINYLKAIERNHQQKQYDKFLAEAKAENEMGQHVLDHGSVLEMLARLNSDEWLKHNAGRYYTIGMFGTRSDPIGANWVQYWFGRNLAIFNSIARNTDSGDRILVIYGAGHGNHLRQLASDSGIYRVHEPMRWLSEQQQGQ